MGDTPWTGDACSLVDAYRAGERSPAEELAATYSAVDASDLNAFSHVDREAAASAAEAADVTLPFGGVPIGVKALEPVTGWPYDRCSMPLAGEVGPYTSTHVERLVAAGAIPAGQTTSSEFGAVNLTRTVLYGTTRNPWDPARTPGGSSGGSAAAVAGGLLTIGTASDGGGSIRIPAGFCGLVGLKATFGRIPLSPGAQYGNLTVAVGCVSRSVRDTARWFDVANGHDARDPLSLVATGGWEAGLGTMGDSLAGRRVAVVADWGGTVVSPAMWNVLAEAAHALIGSAGLQRVDVDTTLPRLSRLWGLSGVLGTYALLGDRWPECADDLTPEVRYGLEVSADRYSIAARGEIESAREALNEAMARIFHPVDGIDFVITASNPDVAFAADGPLPDTFGGIQNRASNNGKLTFPANLHGNPAISVPAGEVDGLPVGLQIVGRHFSEPQLLELAHRLERDRPWPLVVPGAPV